MSITIHFGHYLIIGSALVLSGCDAHHKPTSSSSRPILALEFHPSNPPPEITHFLHDTNNSEPDFYDGKFGDFKGSISTMSLSSNAMAWRVQIAFNGTFSGSGLHQTNEIEVASPRRQQYSLGQIGSVTGWLISEKELQDYYENKLPK
jgi:hypothetical protein